MKRKKGKAMMGRRFAKKCISVLEQSHGKSVKVINLVKQW